MTTSSTLETLNPSDQPTTLEQDLEAARRRIQVDDEELREARRRRRLLGDALTREFTGSDTYINGSVAHGDALTPLTDVDLGVIVIEAKDTHGPGKKGCADLQERAANAMRAALKPEFPDATVRWRDQRRSVLVNFRRPVDPTQDDFTADVIVAIDNPDDEGLYIPNYAGWDRSHPQKHTRMVKAANSSSAYTYARVVRLLKHYNRSNGHPLCSWNIKALALPVLDTPTTLLKGLLTWFDHAIASLDEGLTEDPAQVSDKSIAINKDLTIAQVVDQLEEARDLLHEAVRLERNGWPLQAQEKLAKFFNDDQMMPFPDATRLSEEFSRRIRQTLPSQRTHKGTSDDTAKAAAIATPAAATLAKPAVRSWSPRS